MAKVMVLIVYDDCAYFSRWRKFLVFSFSLRDNPMDGAGIVSILKALATCHSLTELKCV